MQERRLMLSQASFNYKFSIHKSVRYLYFWYNAFRVARAPSNRFAFMERTHLAPYTDAAVVSEIDDCFFFLLSNAAIDDDGGSSSSDGSNFKRIQLIIIDSNRIRNSRSIDGTVLSWFYYIFMEYFLCTAYMHRTIYIADRFWKIR